MKIFRNLLIGLMFICIFTYIVLVQNNFISFDETIYNMVYIYIGVIFFWIFIESVVYSINNKNFLSGTVDKKLDNKKDIKKNINNNDKEDDGLDKKYCINCHREIYISNYTGSNLCVECKNYYYDGKNN